MPAEPGLDLEAILGQVERLLVDTFGFPEAEARQRLTLWRAEQHRLEGEALGTLLPGMSPDQGTQALLRHLLEGHALADQLRAGAAELGLDPPD